MSPSKPASDAPEPEAPRIGAEDWRIDRVWSGDAASLQEVLAIERESFRQPWTHEMYLRELDDADRCHVVLLRVLPEVVAAGLCVFWVVAGELHVNNLAVKHGFRRQGLASALLEDAMGTALRLGAGQGTLEVRASNLAARHLYRRLGFRPVGIRRGYYRHPIEDALVLCCSDIGAGLDAAEAARDAARAARDAASC